MDQQKRLLLTIVLTTIVMLAWMQFFGPKPPEPGAAADAGAVAGAPAGAARPAAPDAGPGATAEVPAPAPAAPGPEAVPEQRFEFKSEAVQLAFTNRGAGLTRAVVLNANHWPAYKFRGRVPGTSGEPEPADVAPVTQGAPPAGAIELGGDLSLSADGTTWQAEKKEGELFFRTSNAQVEVVKRFQVPSFPSYELRLTVAVTNRTGEPKRATLGVLYPAHVDPKTQGKGSFFSPPPELSQVLCLHAGDRDTLGIKEAAEQMPLAGPVQFAAYDERYFLGAVFPRFLDGSSCKLASSPDGKMSARIDADLGAIPPGQTVTREFGFYLGPKSLDELTRVGQANALGAGLTPVGKEPSPGPTAGVDPRLTESIDFGWWAVICRVLLGIMKAFQKVVVNWGVAIVLLTVLVKLALYPLSVKQMESMEAMRRLQPQLDALQKKYEKDKEKMNLERMRLFQENKVNPFGGCLPLLVQMPVWFALYQTLLASFELYREPLVAFWIRDLTAHDPFYVLPLAMGVTMFITQKMQPQMGDPTQAKVMLYFMPIFFTFIMLNLPAGLTLYIFTNNLLSIAQQKWLQHRFAIKRAAA